MILPLTLCLLSAAPQPPARLPLSSLVLYESGIGYFERRGAVRAGQVAEIPLEPGQLDDALKSLVVMSTRGVASADFEPPVSAEAARETAGLGDGDRSVAGLLRALKGAQVEVTRGDGPAVKGRVVEVADEVRHTDKGQELPEPTLVLFGEGGLVKVPVRHVQAVRPADATVAQSWARAAAAEALEPGRQSLKVRGARGEGEVRVGYTTEAPVWRTTYRLVMTPKAGRLQGFALVHNDSDEAWSGVSVTLASGRPTSFVMPLAGPRYGRRELLTPEDGLDAAPQLATREAKEHLLGSRDSVGAGGFGLRGTGSGGGGYGMGSTSAGGRGVLHATVGHAGLLLEDGPTPLAPAAVSEAGDLFLYKVKEAVFLGPRRSALLPILDDAIEAERVTLVGRGGEPQSAVRVRNSTRLTLEGGTVSIYADGAWAGETQVDRIKPGEVRVVPHGADLDVVVNHTQRREAGPVKKVALTGADGQRALELARVDRLVHTVDVTSRAAVPRVLLVELTEAQARITAGADEDVRSPGQPRYARLKVGAKGAKVFEVVESLAGSAHLPLASLTSAAVGALMAGEVPDAARSVLAQLKGDLERSESLQRKLKQLDEAIIALNQDVGQVRASLAAAGKGGAASAARELGERLLRLDAELRAREAERKELLKVRHELQRTLMAAR